MLLERRRSLRLCEPPLPFLGPKCRWCLSHEALKVFLKASDRAESDFKRNSSKRFVRLLFNPLHGESNACFGHV